MQFHSQLIWGFAIEQTLQYLISLLQVKKEMRVHDSAFLLNSFQNWILGTFLFYYEKGKR